MRSRHPLVRWATIAAACIVVLLVVVVLAGLPLYVFPPSAPIQKADLVYVIGPPTESRLEMAQRLRAEGYADRILVSVPREGEQSAARQSICRDPDVVCDHPEPFTTKGEAAMLTRHAGPDAHVLVLTFAPHVLRAQYIFHRCYPGDAAVVEVPGALTLSEWAYQYAYQTGGFVKAWLTPCADPDDL